MNSKTADIRVLLIRLSALGDVVHTLPAADLLRRNLPAAKITWVVEAPFAELLRNNPAVDDVIIFPKKKISSELKNPISWLDPSSEFNKFIGELRSRNFSAALDFQGLFKSGAIAYLSGAPTRVGFAQARELSQIFLTDRCDTGDYFANDKHVVHHNVELSEFYLRIAGGANQESPTIRFPLPILNSQLIASVIEMIGASTVEPPQKVNRARITNTNILSALIRKEGRVQPQMEPGDVVAPVESSAASGAELPASTGTELPAATGAELPAATGKLDALSDSVGAASAMVPTPPAEPAPSAEPLPQIAKNGEKLIVLIPGTTWITKIWPKEKWAQLVSQLVQIPNTRIVLVGGPAETEMNSYIYDQVSRSVADRLRPNASQVQNSGPPDPTSLPISERLIDITGKTTISGLLALLKFADIVVGADTGPLHMAVAAEHPFVIGIHGSTPWLRNGPLGEKSSVVALNLGCQPCFEKKCPLGTLACLRDLNIETVLAEINRVLNVVDMRTAGAEKP